MEAIRPSVSKQREPCFFFFLPFSFDKEIAASPNGSSSAPGLRVLVAVVMPLDDMMTLELAGRGGEMTAQDRDVGNFL